MNNKLKFASAVLSAGLLVTPISSLINNYDNIAKAENNKKVTIKKERLSIEEHKKILNSLYENKIINKDKKNEIENLLQDRSFGRTVWFQYFDDSSKDIHIPSWIISTEAVITVEIVAKIINSVATASPVAATIINASPTKGINYVARILAKAYFNIPNALLNGIVLYYKPTQIYECIGAECYWVTVPEFQHSRIDY